MHTNPCGRTLAALSLTAAMAVASLATAGAATLPALNSPASPETHPGKFVWAELHTSDSAAAAKFYAGVFSWSTTSLERDGVAYTVFTANNHPVAALRQREASASPHASRWIDYISVPNIETALAAVGPAGGIVRAKARPFPDIGTLAIITDLEGAPVGLIQSSSGDAADTEPAVGEWNWFHILSRNPASTAGFYGKVFGLESAPDSRAGSAGTLLLTSGSYNRAGIAPAPDGDDSKPGWLGVIRVTDLDKALERAAALGGKVEVAPHEAVLGSKFAVISDPTGGIVGLVQYVSDANPANKP